MQTTISSPHVQTRAKKKQKQSCKESSPKYTEDKKSDLGLDRRKQTSIFI